MAKEKEPKMVSGIWILLGIWGLLAIIIISAWLFL
jgi:hypothetical protein